MSLGYSIRTERSRWYAAAALLLVAQLIGVAHWHRGPDQSLAVSALSQHIDRFCPICQLAFHAPALGATELFLARPGTAYECPLPLPEIRHRGEFGGWTDSRAPPAFVS